LIFYLSLNCAYADSTSEAIERMNIEFKQRLQRAPIIITLKGKAVASQEITFSSMIYNCYITIINKGGKK